MAVAFKGIKSETGSIDYEGNHTYNRVFSLHGNLTSDSATAVIACLAANGIATFQPHPYDSLARCQRVTVNTVARTTDGANRGCQWEASVDYGPIPPNFAAGGPIAQPPTWRIDPEPIPVPAFLDRNGDPILTSAKGFFDPPLNYTKFVRRLTVRRNEVAPNLGAIEAVENRTNNAPWLIWGAGQVKSLPIKIPERLYDQESEQFYYPMEYSWDIDPDGWKSKIINADFFELDTGGARVRIFDKSGQELTEPALLDADGKRLPEPINPADIVILEFDLIEEADFSIFGLDDLEGLS